MNTPDQNPRQGTTSAIYKITLKVRGLFLLYFSPGERDATFGLVPVPVGADPHPTSFKVKYNGEAPIGLERYLSYNTITELDAEKFNEDATIERKNSGANPTEGEHHEGPFDFAHVLHFRSHLFMNHSNPNGKKPFALKPEEFKGRLRVTRGLFSVSKVFGVPLNSSEPEEGRRAKKYKFKEKDPESPIGNGQFVAEEIQVELSFDMKETVVLNDGNPDPYKFKKEDCTVTLTNVCKIDSSKICHEDFEYLYHAIDLPHGVTPIVPDKISILDEGETIKTNGTSICGGGCTC